MCAPRTLNGAAIALNLARGPDMAFILGQTARGGRIAGMAAMLGIWLRLYAHCVLLIIGTVRLPAHNVEAARPIMKRMADACGGQEGCIAYGYAEDVFDFGLIHVEEIHTGATSRMRTCSGMVANSASPMLVSTPTGFDTSDGYFRSFCPKLAEQKSPRLRSFENEAGSNLPLVLASSALNRRVPPLLRFESWRTRHDSNV